MAKRNLPSYLVATGVDWLYEQAFSYPSDGMVGPSRPFWLRLEFSDLQLVLAKSLHARGQASCFRPYLASN